LSDVENKSHMTRHCIRTKEELECSSDRRENTMYLAQCCSWSLTISLTTKRKLGSSWGIILMQTHVHVALPCETIGFRERVCLMLNRCAEFCLSDYVGRLNTDKSWRSTWTWQIHYFVPFKKKKKQN